MQVCGAGQIRLPLIITKKSFPKKKIVTTKLSLINPAYAGLALVTVISMLVTPLKPPPPDPRLRPPLLCAKTFAWEDK